MAQMTLGLASGGLLALILVTGACGDDQDGASQTSAELRGGNKPDAQIPPAHVGKPNAGAKGDDDDDQDESADGDAASDEDSFAASDEDSDAASDEHTDSDERTDETPAGDAGARPDAGRGRGKPK